MLSGIFVSGRVEVSRVYGIPGTYRATMSGHHQVSAMIRMLLSLPWSLDEVFYLSIDLIF
jgi:hypothetical protein